MHVSDVAVLYLLMLSILLFCYSGNARWSTGRNTRKRASSWLRPQRRSRRAWTSTAERQTAGAWTLQILLYFFQGNNFKHSSDTVIMCREHGSWPSSCLMETCWRGVHWTLTATAELEETKPGFPTSRIVAFRASQTLVYEDTVDSLDHGILVYSLTPPSPPPHLLFTSWQCWLYSYFI